MADDRGAVVDPPEIDQIVRSLHGHMPARPQTIDSIMSQPAHTPTVEWRESLPMTLPLSCPLLSKR